MGIRKPKKKSNVWEHSQFLVEIISFYSDQAYKTIRLTCKNLPGLVAVEHGELKINYEHIFEFSLPREYPQNLGTIQIIPKTPLFHPRIREVGTKACYVVNGEIDRILIDIIFNILLRPNTVQPPSLYKDADWGLDSQKMRWYIQYGPEKMYEYLKSLWSKQQKQSKANLNITKAKKVSIIE